MDRPSDRAPHWLGSFVSAFVGWLTFLLVSSLTLRSSPDEYSSVVFYAVILGVVTFLVWLFVLSRLYIIIPARSLLWRWWICTLCGTAAGTLIGCAVFVILDLRGMLERPLDFIGASFVLGGIIGGVTCLFGSLTVPLFRRRDSFRVFARRGVQLLARVRRMVRRGRARFDALAGQ